MLNENTIKILFTIQIRMPTRPGRQISTNIKDVFNFCDIKLWDL